MASDIRYDDPRPDSARAADEAARSAEQVRLEASWTAKGLKEGDEGWGVPENHAGENPLGIVWGEDNFDMVSWSDDPLLRDFENNVYDLAGFKPSGDGF